MDLSVGTRLAEYLEVTRRSSEVFWLRLKKWFLVAAVVGILVGGFVTLLDTAVLLIWRQALPRIDAVTIVLYPTVGLLLSGLILQYFTVNPGIHGTEEVIEAFHKRGGVFRYRSFPGKILAAVATVGFGGSAGLEGPSIYAGGAIGSFLLRKARRFGFTEEDVRTMMVAGAAAGVAAIFKAPLTGIVFALEVPYRDDLTREALIPSLISAVSSYIVLVQFLGVEPLFDVTEINRLSMSDLLYSIAIGLLVGIVARMFIVSYHGIGRFARALPVPLWVRTGLGGMVAGILALVGYRLFGEPVVFGTGYSTVQGFVSGAYTPLQSAEILLLKTGAVVATLASGAAGGIFVPMIVLGAATGALLKGVLPGAVGPISPIVGMAAFLAAGYNTPIAATVFVAESTGGAGYIIPGLVASAVAFAVAGRTSVSDMQRWRRETRLDRLLRASVGAIMTRDVVTLPSHESVYEFVTHHMVRLRHKSMPVVDQEGQLVGMVGLSDIGTVPRADWSRLTLADVMCRDVHSITPGTHVGDVVALMAEFDIDRVPVVDEAAGGLLVGIVSSTDVVAMDDVFRDSRRRADTG